MIKIISKLLISKEKTSISKKKLLKTIISYIFSGNMSKTTYTFLLKTSIININYGGIYA